ncbi:MAG: hypothetical protein HRU31_07710, partial [Rhodobacteraceae bacterium]|nr:hypothetical protein [Paracoccaceae bacterium]
MKKLTDISGIGPAMAKAMENAGFGDVAKIADSTADKLVAVRGVGLARAPSLIAAARTLMDQAMVAAQEVEDIVKSPSEAKEPKKAKATAGKTLVTATSGKKKAPKGKTADKRKKDSKAEKSKAKDAKTAKEAKKAKDAKKAKEAKKAKDAKTAKDAKKAEKAKKAKKAK